jgi:hypothetical protein
MCAAMGCGAFCRERGVCGRGSHGGAGGGWWEVKALASFIPCSPGVPHRADIAHKALIVTAGFPKYEALRGFRCVPQWGVGRFVARGAFEGVTATAGRGVAGGKWKL